MLNAASTFSSFAGLGASLILASMVIILVEYKGEENPSAAVAMFTVALLALGGDTFVFGAVSGEALCARGAAQGLVASSVMAPGATILMLGVVLLQTKFKHAHAVLTLLGNVVTSMGALAVMTLLGLWAVRIVNNMIIMRLRPGPLASYAPPFILVGVFFAIIVVIGLAGPSDRARQNAVVVTTCIYLVHILMAFVMYAVTIIIPATQWTVHTDSLVVTVMIIITLAFPFVELIGVVMALDWRGGRREFWHQT